MENNLDCWAQRVVNRAAKSSRCKVAHQRSVLGSVSSIIFINDLDNGIEGILSKLVDNTKLEEVATALEGRAAIQEDLDRLEKWADSKLTKFGKSPTLEKR